jgi:hypothetical protein
VKLTTDKQPTPFSRAVRVSLCHLVVLINTILVI